MKSIKSLQFTAGLALWIVFPFWVSVCSGLTQRVALRCGTCFRYKPCGLNPRLVPRNGEPFPPASVFFVIAVLSVPDGCVDALLIMVQFSMCVNHQCYPPLLFCTLICCFLSSHCTNPLPVMHVFVVCVCACIRACVCVCVYTLVLMHMCVFVCAN